MWSNLPGYEYGEKFLKLLKKNDVVLIISDMSYSAWPSSIALPIVLFSVLCRKILLGIGIWKDETQRT